MTPEKEFSSLIVPPLHLDFQTHLNSPPPHPTWISSLPSMGGGLWVISGITQSLYLIERKSSNFYTCSVYFSTYKL